MGGLWKQMNIDAVSDVIKTKAHRSAEDAAGDPYYAGNHTADLLAKRAARIMGPSDGIINQNSEAYSRHRVLLKHVAKAISKSFELPRIELDITLKPRKPRVCKVQREPHTFVWSQRFGKYVCTACRIVRKRPCARVACHALPVWVRALADDPKGHQLRVAVVEPSEDRRRVYFCRRCGCYAEVRPIHLADFCRAGASGQLARVKRVRRGFHPAEEASISDVRPLPRAAQASAGRAGQAASRRDLGFVRQAPDRPEEPALARLADRLDDSDASMEEPSSGDEW